MGGVEQHIVAGAFGVNPGRVSEAVQAMRLVLNDPKGVREVYEASNRDVDLLVARLELAGL